MGVVYDAEDTELGRHVALKFLPRETASSPEALERFRREARAASSLSHPHICAVYDLGVHEGQPYLVLELLRGHTLRNRIEARALSMERIVELGTQIASALDAAHRAGIVHRDLKPANLFVTESGDAKILDFGIAKRNLDSEISAMTTAAYGAPPVQTPRTATGTILGTVQYMSPEQARGAEVDARSDLFAFGVVLYEMTTGQRPFVGVTTADQFAELLKGTPRPPRELNPAVPPELEELILWCLEKDPERRCPNAAEARAKLREIARGIGIASSTSVTRLSAGAPKPLSSSGPRRGTIALAVAVLVIAAGAVVYLVGPERAARPVAADGALASVESKRLAVLPFENVGTAEDVGFADGMADEVRSKLAGLGGLSVIARASSNEYRGTKKELAAVARELGVRYLLNATVRWQTAGGTTRIRVTPELVEISGTDAPTTRWQETYDGELADVFAVQSRIATEVAKALEVALGAPQTARLEQRPTSDLAAWSAYLEGRRIDETGFDPATQRDAAQQFERAVALDPRFALAWAWLSTSKALAYANGARDPALAEASRAAAERAASLAPDLPESFWALGVYRRNVLGDNVAAIEITRRGLAVAPENPDLLRILGFAEINAGRLDRALEAQRTAARVDPRSWRNQAALADTLLRLRRPREARAAIELGKQLNPSNAILVYRLVVSYLQEGDVGGARAALAGAPAAIDPTVLVALFSGDSHLVWLLDDERRELLRRLTPSAFDGDAGRWASAMADDRWFAGDREGARRHAESARHAFAAEIARGDRDPLLHSSLGAALAILGRGAEAESEATRGVDLSRNDRGDEALALDFLAVTRTRAGDAAGAVEALGRLLAAPHYTNRAWLRVDPTFESLRGRADFERLVQETP